MDAVNINDAVENAADDNVNVEEADEQYYQHQHLPAPEVDAKGVEMEGDMLPIASDCSKLSRVNVVPIQDGSIGSSCGSQRSKLRLCLEMSIKGKMTTGGDLPDDDHEKYSNVDPVTVTIDYPEDIAVAINAKIQKFDTDILTPSDYGDVVDRKGWHQCKQGLVVDHNENKVLDSTFVKAKAPLSSTLIYPIIEEPEANVLKKGEDNWKAEIAKSGRKSNSAKEDASLYHTVLGDNDGMAGFGNISAIGKSDEKHKEVSQNPVSADNLIFGAHPSAKLNASSLLFRSEKEPAQDLAKALHILARYHGRWGIYEDETCIEHYLRNLNSVLTVTDKTTVLNICCDENYQEVKSLISYFTLEKRFLIRSELLQTFTLLCAKSRTLSSFIYASEIPVVLARTIENGDVTSREMYVYASYLLEIMSKVWLSDNQCEDIGKTFYSSLCGMIMNADKKNFKTIAEILFDLLLHFHQQLKETELKWQSLYSAAKDKNVVKKIKSKLTAIFMRNASLSPRSEDNPKDWSGPIIKDVLVVMKDFIICDATRDLFTDEELDVILVTLMHNLHSDRLVEWQREAVITIYRILLTIKTKPSGLDKLDHLITDLLNDDQNLGTSDRCYRSVLKKIYKILQLS